MYIKERILQYLEYKGISATKAEMLLEWGKGTLIKSKSVSADKAGEILLLFPDLSAEWLMRGEGPMLRPDPSQSIGDIIGSTAVGNNVHGSGNNITSHAELADIIHKKDEQIDRLLAIIENLSK